MEATKTTQHHVPCSTCSDDDSDVRVHSTWLSIMVLSAKSCITAASTVDKIYGADAEKRSDSEIDVADARRLRMARLRQRDSSSSRSGFQPRVFATLRVGIDKWQETNCVA